MCVWTDQYAHTSRSFWVTLLHIYSQTYGNISSVHLTIAFFIASLKLECRVTDETTEVRHTKKMLKKRERRFTD